jgi:hypothetical protein
MINRGLCARLAEQPEPPGCYLAGATVSRIAGCPGRTVDDAAATLTAA